MTDAYKLWKSSRSKMLDYLRQPIKFQDRYGKPMLVGEFGCSRMSGHGKNQEPWLSTAVKVFEEFGWSWTWHTFSENDGDPFRTPTLDLMAKLWEGQ